MLKKLTCLLGLGFFFFLISVFAEISTEEILLKPVFKDTPAFKRLPANEYGKEYPLKMVKLKNSSQVKVPPQTEAVVLYYGEVKLGNPLQTYGILVDFEAKDKVLWVDADGDGDFSKEEPYAIFKSDRFPGVNVYYSPVPLVFQVKFAFLNHTYQTQMQFDMQYLLIAKSGFQDNFYLKNRTWLVGVLMDEDQEFNLAFVDTDDNGLYHDAEDFVFIDRDFDMSFSLKEENAIKKLKKFKLKSKIKYELDLEYLPEKIMLKKDER